MDDSGDRSGLIAGYIDGVLDDGQRAEVARRIASDTEWRGEHDVQIAVRERLGRLDSPRLPLGARARLGAALRQHASGVEGAGVDAPGVVVPFASIAPPDTPSADALGSSSDRPNPSVSRRVFIAAAAMVLVGVLAWQAYGWWSKRPPSLIGEALAQLEAVELDPMAWKAGSAADVSEKVASLGWAYHELEDAEQELEYIGMKETEIDGERALTVAYRRGDEVVVQILIDQQVFNADEEIEDSVSTVTAEHTLVGWNDGEHSVVMVGSGDPTQLLKFRPEECYGYKRDVTAFLPVLSRMFRNEPA